MRIAAVDSFLSPEFKKQLPKSKPTCASAAVDRLLQVVKAILTEIPYKLDPCFKIHKGTANGSRAFLGTGIQMRVELAQGMMAMALGMRNMFDFKRKVENTTTFAQSRIWQKYAEVEGDVSADVATELSELWQKTKVAKVVEEEK